jgi:hypothetical protein
MNLKTCSCILLTGFGLLLQERTTRAVSILFNENFSSGLGAWTGKNDGPHQGQILTDPLNAANSVLSFTGLNVSGDIFTRDLIPVGNASQILLSFDYLGLAISGSVPGNIGGFIGISDTLNPQPNGAAWVGGTELSAVNGLGFTGIELIDDAVWHHYEIDLTQMLKQNNIAGIHIMIEDWLDAGGVPGDAYFDNIQVATVPENLGFIVPTLSFCLLLFFHARSKRRQTVMAI